MKRKIQKLRIPVLFLTPLFLIYTIFVFIPMLLSLYYSATEWNGVTDKVFVGLQNYKSLFSYSDFWVVFSNTIKLVVITLIVQIPMGLILAYLLYNKTKGMKIFRTIYFLPVVIAPVAIGLMFTLFYNSEIGIFNNILKTIGLGRLQRNWLSDTHT
ncbi:MAG: sugar ABC transporter permease, partial [Mobilitalea sp.]